MFPMRSEKGNMLLLAVSAVAFMVLVSFLVLNYNQLMVVQKQAQSAIDAAALQAVKEMGRVVVDGPHGRLALVDDPAGNSKWPVVGVNTQLATLRLDAVIANKLNNKSILYMVQHDLAQTEEAIKQLNTKLTTSADGGSGAYDRDGKPVNIRDAVYQTYLANEIRLSGSKEPPANFQIVLGRLKATASKLATTIPVPSPENFDSVTFGSGNSKVGTDNQKYYVADVDYEVTGTSKTVRFGFVGLQPALVENSLFEKAGPTDIPVLAQVIADQPVQRMADTDTAEQKKTREKINLHTVATAQVGNRTLIPNPGTFEVAFPGGIPPKSGNLAFTSPVSIMNASQIDPAGNTESPYTGWNSSTPGKYFVAEGGPVWGSGTLKEAAFKNIKGRTKDDPSVALSFFAYDWLRSLYYRPNAKGVVDALNSAFTDVTTSQTFGMNTASYKQNWLPSAYAAAGDNGITTGMLTILPGSDNLNGVLVNGVAVDWDPRNLSNYLDNPDGYQRQHARMWGYVPADGVLPSGTLMVSFHPENINNPVQSVDGNPWYHVRTFVWRLKELNACGVIIHNAVSQILNDAQKADPVLSKMQAQSSSVQKDLLAAQQLIPVLEQQGATSAANAIKRSANSLSAEAKSFEQKIEDKKEEINAKVFKDNPKVLAAFINSVYAMEVSTAMLNNMKTLSGVGIKMPLDFDDSHFIVAGSDFWVPKKPFHMATLHSGYTNQFGVHDWQQINVGTSWAIEQAYIKQQMLNKESGKLPTMSSPGAPGAQDWLALPVNEGGKAKSQMVFYKRNADPQIGKRTPESGWMLPVLAQSAAPSAKFIYHYYIDNGSASLAPGQQKIVVEVDKVSKFSSTPTGQGQVVYQTTDGLETGVPCQGPTLSFQVQGRDLHANAYPENTNDSSPGTVATYYDGGLVSAWAITCPMVPDQCISPRVPNVQTLTDLVRLIEVYCSGSAGSSAFSYLEATGFAWMFTTVVPGDGSMDTPWGSFDIRRFGALDMHAPLPSYNAT